MSRIYSIIFLVVLISIGCNNPDPDFGLKKTLPLTLGADTRAVIEIPAGTLDKYELNKDKLTIEHEYKNGVPRVVQYLAYPGNYGYIPHTLLSKKQGGDGDPLDVLVLGSNTFRGAKIDIKVIGILKLLDRGEQDDKLIAVTPNTPFWDVSSVEDLELKFPGALTIIETWFSNYKGIGQMQSEGFYGRDEALRILEMSKTDKAH